MENVTMENNDFCREQTFSLKPRRSGDEIILGTYIETVYNGPQGNDDEDHTALIINRLYTHIFKNGNDEFKFDTNEPLLLTILNKQVYPVVCANALDVADSVSSNCLFAVNGRCYRIQDGNCGLHPALQHVRDATAHEFYTLTVTGPEVCRTAGCTTAGCGVSGGKSKKYKKHLRNIKRRSRKKKTLIRKRRSS
jgi:hypothetical protein